MSVSEIWLAIVATIMALSVLGLVIAVIIYMFKGGES